MEQLIARAQSLVSRVPKVQVKSFMDESCSLIADLIERGCELKGDVDRLVTSAKAWELQAKGYGKVIERQEREIADLQTLVPHPGDGTCDRCGTGGAEKVTIALCEECRELEREIAYHAARSDIECYCEGERHSGPHIGAWYDTTNLAPESDQYVDQAVRYLESRKLLKRHPENFNLVRPLDVEVRS